jgi:hypothetical protein
LVFRMLFSPPIGWGERHEVGTRRRSQEFIFVN